MVWLLNVTAIFCILQEEVHLLILLGWQGVREVEEWMSQSSGIPLEELRPHMFLLRDRDATSHLMRFVSAPYEEKRAVWKGAELSI